MPDSGKTDAVSEFGPERIRVVFRLEQDADGWPPAGSERLWAVPLPGNVAKIDNVPVFVPNLAWGDLVQTEPREGEIWAVERLKWSGRCTIRVIPTGEGPFAGSRQAVLDAFEPLGVGGEGIEQFGIVALDVPEDADLVPVVGLLRRGRDDGWWEYEEGCVGDAWQAVKTG